jgi:hypothetical protein
VVRQAGKNIGLRPPVSSASSTITGKSLDQGTSFLIYSQRSMSARRLGNAIEIARDPIVRSAKMDLRQG